MSIVNLIKKKVTLALLTHSYFQLMEPDQNYIFSSFSLALNYGDIPKFLYYNEKIQIINVERCVLTSNINF